ncbi:MAG: ribosome-associated translation inhibitor RaiA [Clostridia bacterium]|nr:ribosome-associated translation inhibitor RaiA [Clostridia bacterium]
MKITIIARQVTVTDDLKELVSKKLSKFDKFFSDEAEAFVTFSKKKNTEKLEVTISYSGTLFRSEVEDETFNNSLDRCVENIERQIRKNKTRLERRLRQGAFADYSSLGSEAVAEEGEFKIRVKSFSFKPMSPEEAILQMNLLSHKFYVFVNSETNETCVVYKREDGAYGLIVPSEEH